MKRISVFALCLFGLVESIGSANAALTSMYVFGDGVSTTTDNVPASPYYHGNRYCNGRVWVELLAQRQGLNLPDTNNWSYYGHYSRNLVTNVNTFVAPADANTALFVVWVGDADFVDFLADSKFSPYTSNNIAVWTNAINQSISNQLAAVETLYAKGARTLVMPTAVDITKVPYYEIGLSNEAFIRQQIIAFNTQFRTRLAQAQALLTNLTLIIPDFFAAADGVIANPAAYGMTNSTGAALFELADVSLDGPGTNYVFWDDLNPGAKTQEILADTAQQLISPVRISRLTVSANSNQLTVVNVPIGLNGFVDSSTNLMNWTQTLSFDSTNATQTLSVPVAGPMMFHRLRFPFSWTWP